jgi:hypothetical protein
MSLLTRALRCSSWLERSHNPRHELCALQTDPRSGYAFAVAPNMATMLSGGHYLGDLTAVETGAAIGNGMGVRAAVGMDVSSGEYNAALVGVGIGSGDQDVGGSSLAVSMLSRN